MTDQADAVPLETGALWNLIDRAEHGVGTALEARVLRGCVRVVVDRARRAEARVAELEAELAQLRADAAPRIGDHTYDGPPAAGYRCQAVRFGQTCGGTWEQHDLRDEES